MVSTLSPEESAAFIASHRAQREKEAEEKAERARQRAFNRSLLGEKAKAPSKLLSLTTVLYTPVMGKRMKYARYLMKLSQRELAARLLITQKTVSLMEHGKVKKIPAVTTKAVMDAYGHYAEYVVFGTGARKVEGELLANSPWRTVEA